MNEITSNLSTTYLPSNKIAVTVDPELYKFISIILDSKKLGSICEEKKVVIWLKEIDAENEVKLKDESQVSKFIFPVLRLEPTSSQKKIEKRQRIALLYAKILAQYVPEENGNIDFSFNYYELVTAVKKVFKNHLNKNACLFSTGIQISVEGKLFCAKVDLDKICIFHNVAPCIGKGNYGSVWRIYEIATRQFLAFKNSIETEDGIQAITEEISNLKMLHSLAEKSENSSVEGLQAAPYMTLDIPSFVGFVGPIYGLDLEHWILDNHENDERLAICKFLMLAFKNKTNLKIWHGDLKASNVLIHDKGCVIVDWAGAISYQKALEDVTAPTVFSSDFTSLNDKRIFSSICKEIEIKGKEDKNLNSDFFELANVRDLFSLAITLFMILTSEVPFEKISLIRVWPITEKGIRESARNKLIEKNYSSDVMQTITKMLAHDYKDRYSVQDAIEVWDRIKVEK